MNVKTRFAPSPTGGLHIGNVRTALYSWLFARNQGGKFLLRIEDTNSIYSINNSSVKNIISIMNWLNLDWDEGPYFQTDRFDRYNDIIDDMLKHHLAYKCYCSSDRLKLLRSDQIKRGEKPKYDRHCRIKRSTSDIMKNVPYVVRFCNPETGKVQFYDKIRGMISFDNQELDDLIIRRANGIPTYNFCVIVDDMDMNITHVIRGEEHINNTPRQINILKSLNAFIPIYAHVPMILDEDRKKLSKRDGALGVMQYRNDGFLPESILNYLVRLGWSYGNQEIFSIEQMKKCFNLQNINKSASVFSFEKLLWLNRYYINHLPVNYIASHLSKYMDMHNINYDNGPKLSDIVKLFAKRASTLQDIAYNFNCLYNKNFNIYEKQLAKQYLTPVVMNPLKILRNKLSCINVWKLDCIKFAIKETIVELNISMCIVGMPIRVALTGTDQSPEISLIMYVFGKNQVLNRIDQAISYIDQINLNNLTKN